MTDSVKADLWERAQTEKPERNGYWALWPLLLLFLFQPSFHRPLAAVPLVILAVARERGAGWAWRGAAFWVALALFGLALIGDDLMPFASFPISSLQLWAYENPHVLVLPVLGCCGLIAAAFAGGREHGWIASWRQDRQVKIGMPGTSRASETTGMPTRRPNPRLRELLAAQMEASSYFKQVSDRYASLIEQGDRSAAESLKHDVDQAKQAYDAARREFQAAKIAFD